MFSFLKPAYGFTKKVFLVVAIFFIVISLFTYFINGDRSKLNSQNSQISPLDQNRMAINQIINDKKLNSTKEGKLIIAFDKSLFCRIVGEACATNSENNYQNSMTGMFARVIKAPIANPPASGIAWVSNGLEQAGFVPKSFAAEGVGMSAIQAYSDIWKLFRDISYMLLVVFLIVIGFMVMFRTKLNPQTVISVENALPKIVITLILITFSFAIAGFLIDLMYIITSIMISVLSKNDTYYVSTTFKNQYFLSSWFDI